MYNDASAVQFTRNPDGIAGALKRIGGLKSGSKVVNPGAAEVSHAFFAQGVSGFMQSLAATHPPLKKRILRIDPHWDGKFDTSDKIESPRDKEEPVKKQTMTREQLAINATTLAAGAAMADVSNAIDQIGNPKPETINQARVLISGLPTVIKEAAHEPYGARAVIYSLVFDPEQEILGKQMAHLQLHADPDVFELTHKLLPDMNGLEIKYRLPIIDIAIPTLKQLSPAQYQVFRDNLVALIQMDSRVDLMEWLLQKILFNHLDGHFIKIARTNLHSTNIDQLKHEIELVLSIMAHSGDQSQNEIEGAFEETSS